MSSGCCARISRSPRAGASTRACDLPASRRPDRVVHLAARSSCAAAGRLRRRTRAHDATRATGSRARIGGTSSGPGERVHAVEAAERVAEVGRVAGVDREVRVDPRHQVVTEERQELVSAAVIVLLGEQRCVTTVTRRREIAIPHRIVSYNRIARYPIPTTSSGGTWPWCCMLRTMSTAPPKKPFASVRTAHRRAGVVGARSDRRRSVLVTRVRRVRQLTSVPASARSSSCTSGLTGRRVGRVVRAFGVGDAFLERDRVGPGLALDEQPAFEPETLRRAAGAAPRSRRASPRTARRAAWSPSPAPTASTCSTKPSVGSTASTRPMRSASCASMMRADSTSSAARPAPTSRGSRCVPPAPGMMPTATSGWPKCARSLATRKRAREGELAPAAPRLAVDGGDDRLRHRLEDGEGPGPRARIALDRLRPCRAW